MEDKIVLYHGGASVVRIPDLTMSREDIDFGRGFYLSDDYNRSAKWACRKATSIVNEYELSLSGLKVHRFLPDIEWLDFVVANRQMGNLTEAFAEIASCDVLIGPIADDKLFSLIELYEDGIVPAETAVEVMNCMNYGTQYTLKTDNAVKKLSHLGHTVLLGQERLHYQKLFTEDAKEASRKTQNLLRDKNQGR